MNFINKQFDLIPDVTSHGSQPIRTEGTGQTYPNVTSIINIPNTPPLKQRIESLIEEYEAHSVNLSKDVTDLNNAALQNTAYVYSVRLQECNKFLTQLKELIK